MSEANQARVPFVDLGAAFKQQESELTEAFLAVGRSGQYILSDKVSECETKLARFCNVPYALGVGNGTDGLALILKAMGIGPGDEVVSVSNTFIGTLGAVIQVGATPVCVDVGDDYNLDPSQLDNVRSDNTKAVIAVHLTGNPAAMNDINNWAQQHQLKVIEDAAQAIGALYEGKPVGGLADAASFSLHPLKILGGLGDAGFITTHDEHLYKQIKHLRNHGLKNRDESQAWGVNSRLDALQAAFIDVRLKHLPKMIKAYQAVAQQYQNGLKPLAEHHLLKLPTSRPQDIPVYHNFIIRTRDRDALQKYLGSQGIETKIHYPKPIHKMQCFKQDQSLPNTELLCKEILSLPIYPELQQTQVEAILNAIYTFFNHVQQEGLSVGTSHRSSEALSSY